jgi:TrmH family RNA methyltransferase
MERITSAENPSLKLARKLLKSSRERERSGKILLDGVHLVSEYAARFDLSTCIVFVDEVAAKSSEITAILNALPAAVRVLELPSQLFASISPVDTPAGIVALCDRPHVADADESTGFWLLLDGIQDPGNLGAILRTAAAMGVDGVFMTSTCVDAWSPKCLRGGMGAQFVLPLRQNVDMNETLRTFEGKRVATSSHGGQSLMKTDLSGHLLAVFGGEGAGLANTAMDMVGVTVCIPMNAGMESLNVGAATAMFCYERARQLMV